MEKDQDVARVVTMGEGDTSRTASEALAGSVEPTTPNHVSHEVIARARSLIGRVGVPQAYSMEGPANPEHETYSLCCDDPAGDGESHACFGTVVAATEERASRIAHDIGEAFAIVAALLWSEQ